MADITLKTWKSVNKKFANSKCNIYISHRCQYLSLKYQYVQNYTSFHGYNLCSREY